LLEQHALLPYTAEALRLLTPLAARSDVVLCTALCYAVPLAAELAGVPWASALFSPIAFFSAHDPCALQPLPWLPALCAPLPLRLRRTLLDVARAAGSARSRATLNPLRAAHGLPLLPRPAACIATLSPHASLLLAPAALFPRQPDWPPSAHPCGTVLYDALVPPPTALAAGAEAAQEALRAFLHDAPPGADARPVVFALGSVIGHLDKAVSLVRLFADAVALLPPGARAVIVTGPVAWPLLGAALNNGTTGEGEEAGGAAAPQGVAPTAPRRPRLVAVPWAPYGALFQHAAAVVHQGGARCHARTCVSVSLHALRSTHPSFSHAQARARRPRRCAPVCRR
jgi:UDP:flavonoid glycosyltransferase YjiC (YdhE family)